MNVLVNMQMLPRRLMPAGYFYVLRGILVLCGYRSEFPERVYPN